VTAPVESEALDGTARDRDDLAANISRIAAALEGPATPEAAERIAAARRRWPENLRLMLLQGSWLEKTARLDEAETCYGDALAGHPQNPWPALRLTELFLSQRRP
jgi:Flp pilus assembly protein TadD